MARSAQHEVRGARLIRLMAGIPGGCLISFLYSVFFSGYGLRGASATRNSKVKAFAKMTYVLIENYRYDCETKRIEPGFMDM